MQGWQTCSSWCGSLAAGLVQLVFTPLGLSQLGACCCTVVYPAGTELQATVDSLTEFSHFFPQIFQHLLVHIQRIQGFDLHLCNDHL